MGIPLWQKLVSFLNGVAGVWGVYFYYAFNPMLPFFPIFLWPLIADSPVSVLLAAIAFAGIIKEDWFKLLAASYLVKYGFWSAFVILFNWGYYYTSLQDALFVSALFLLPHLLMVVESILLIPKKFDFKIAPAIIGWFLLNDYLDYLVPFHLSDGRTVQGMHTFIPDYGMNVVFAVALFLSIATPLIFYWKSKELANAGAGLGQFLNKLEQKILRKN
ncbi:Uncharacterised protein [Candidatus Gugararchaeum adminiculabundum]|nr:Uncharacterised protein [Candidatus Gugararchaeum adminiculabundum]